MATVLSAALESFPYNSEINNDLCQDKKKVRYSNILMVLGCLVKLMKWWALIWFTWPTHSTQQHKTFLKALSRDIVSPWILSNAAYHTHSTYASHPQFYSAQWCAVPRRRASQWRKRQGGCHRLTLSQLVRQRCTACLESQSLQSWAANPLGPEFDYCIRTQKEPKSQMKESLNTMIQAARIPINKHALHVWKPLHKTFLP